MENTFHYQYSAKENAEVQAIRNKYLPKTESKFDELKRLDSAVQASGVMESLSAGIGGALVLGIGFCLAMGVIGSGGILVLLGILLGMIGIAGMLVAYPIYRRVFENTKSKYTPRILELAQELSREGSQ